MEPKCPKCGKSEFDIKPLENADISLIFCEFCGTIVGQKDDSLYEMANDICKLLNPLGEK